MRSWITENKKDKEVSYAQYKVLNTTVMVGSRPDRVGISKETAESVSAWLSVTDRFVDYPVEYKVRWFPWNEGSEAPYTVLYPSLITLRRWIIDDELPRVYIHCDAGTHRAPIIFGAFIHTFFEKEKEEIVKNVEIKNREYLSDPLSYFDTHLLCNPEDHKFVEMMRNFNFVKDRDFNFMENDLDKYDLKDIVRTKSNMTI